MDMNDLNQEIKMLKEEIESWNLNEENHQAFDAILNCFFQVRHELHKEVIANRNFCYVCATKALVQKTVDGNIILDFLSQIKNLPLNLDIFVYTLKEFLFLVSMVDMAEQTGLNYIVEHLKDHLKLNYPNLKTDEDKQKILNLRVTCLGINAMLSEIMTKILDFIEAYVHNMRCNEDVERRIITFLIERIFGSFKNFTIMHDESNKAWTIIFNKFNSLYEGMDLCDPLIITKDG